MADKNLIAFTPSDEERDRYKTIATTLVSWFQESRRSFPWRVDRTPYRVLVSEVMLQQTQASRVIGYFQRWMEKFPSIELLASSSVEEVLKVWEGLGYYSRARSLKKAAEYIVFELQGVFPEEYEELQKVPGIGPYTAGAIRSFAFNKPTPAVDANVIRLFARLFNIQAIATTKNVKNILNNHAQALIDATNSPLLVESCIEFGAKICTPSSPKCREACPLDQICEAFSSDTVDLLPIRAEKKGRLSLYRTVFIIRSKGSNSFLIIERSGKKVMSGLHEFPFFEHAEEKLEVDSIHEALSSLFLDQPFEEKRSFPLVFHTFTRFKVSLNPILLEVEEPFSFDAGEDIAHWSSYERLAELPFSSGHKKIYEHIKRLYSL